MRVGLVPGIEALTVDLQQIQQKFVQDVEGSRCIYSRMHQRGERRPGKALGVESDVTQIALVFGSLAWERGGVGLVEGQL